MRYSLNTVIVGIFIVVGIALLGVQYLRAFPTIPKHEDDINKRLSMFLQIDHPYVKKGSDGDILLNTNIKGADAPIVDRAPVNLVLVIDRSGSMGEKGKIDYARRAAKEVIAGLGEQDRLSIVAYSTDVQVMLPIQFLSDKERATSVVNSIHPTHSTNLSGGLTTGIAQLDRPMRKGYVNRIILLSDGLANAGITDIGELNKIASNAAEKGIHVTTMGLGVDYDEDLLMSLAEYGAGNYYFVESPAQLAGIFDKEFGRLASTVAKDPVYTLTLAPGVSVKEVYGYRYETMDDGKVKIKLGDFYGGQERNILIRLNVPSGNSGESNLLSAKIEYQDVLDNDQAVYQVEKLSYQVTDNEEIVTRNENKDVSARGVSMDAAKEFYQATEEWTVSQGNGNAIMQKAYQKVVELNQAAATPETLEQEAEMREALSTMTADSAPEPGTPEAKALIKENKSKARQQQQ